MAQMHSILLVIYLLVMLPIAAFILREACAFCGEDMPTYRKAALVVLLVGPAAFFTFDLTAYAIALSSEDVVRQLPPGYSYLQWLQEHVVLKWQAVSLVPGVRYLAVVFALCLAGVLQVLLLHVTFRMGLLIFAIQWFCNVVALALLTFLFALTQSYLTQHLQPHAPVGRSEGLAQLKRPAKGEAPAPPEPHQGEPRAEAPGDHSTTVDPYLKMVKEVLAEVDPYLATVKTECAPLTRHLPVSAQRFLDAGGWWLVIGAAGLVALLWLRSTAVRLKRAIFRKKKKARKKKKHDCDLAMLSEGYTEVGPRQVTVKGLPARLRIVIMAPAGKDVGDLKREMADHLLDWIMPGLSEIAAHDLPSVRVWERQYSESGFNQALLNSIKIPEAKGTRSHWVVVAGSVTLGRQKIHAGLVLYTEDRNSIRQVIVGQKWLDALGVREEMELARSR